MLGIDCLGLDRDAMPGIKNQIDKKIEPEVDTGLTPKP